MKSIKVIFLATLALLATAIAFAMEEPAPASLPAGQHLFVIEREIPNAGKLTKDELKQISEKSCGVLRQMGLKIQWLHSYVTGDKVYCVYIAPDAGTIREHARKGGFPANSVSEVANIFGPDGAK